jgi:hypothetical protein
MLKKKTKQHELVYCFDDWTLHHDMSMMLKSSRYLQGIIPEKIPWLVATRFHIQYCKRKKKQ